MDLGMKSQATRLIRDYIHIIQHVPKNISAKQTTSLRLYDSLSGVR